MAYLHIFGTFFVFSSIFIISIFAEAIDTNTIPSALNLIERYGSIVGILGIFVYWTWIREQRMAKQIADLEIYVKEKLISNIQATTNTINTNVETMKIINAAIEEFGRVINKLSNETHKLNITIKKSPYLVVASIDRSKIEDKSDESKI